MSGPLPTFYQRLSTGKSCYVMDTRRDFIYVTDTIDMVEMALDGKGDTGTYHISSGTDFSIKELFDATAAALDISLDEPVEVRARDKDDVYSMLLDPSKTFHDFGWTPSTSLERGVRQTVDWYREYGVSKTYTHLKPAELE